MLINVIMLIIIVKGKLIIQQASIANSIPISLSRHYGPELFPRSVIWKRGIDVSVPFVILLVIVQSI